jgi:hypothetical protein
VATARARASLALRDTDTARCVEYSLLAAALGVRLIVGDAGLVCASAIGTTPILMSMTIKE